LLRFREKGGKEKELPVHHKLEELLDEYLKATGLGAEPGSLLFPAALRNNGKLTRRPLRRTDAADMLKRRLKQAGLPAHYSPHSFRATGIKTVPTGTGRLSAWLNLAPHLRLPQPCRRARLSTPLRTARRLHGLGRSPTWPAAERNPATVEILLNPDGTLWQERLGAAPAIILSLFDIYMQRELDRHFEVI